MKIVAMAMFLGEDKVPLRIGKMSPPTKALQRAIEDKVPLRIGKMLLNKLCGNRHMKIKFL